MKLFFSILLFVSINTFCQIVGDQNGLPVKNAANKMLLMKPSWTFKSVQSGALDQVGLGYRVKTGGNVWINWGNTTAKLTADNTDRTINSAFVRTDVEYSIIMFGDLDSVTRITLGESKVYLSLASIKNAFHNLLVLSLSSVNINGANGGDIAYLPKTLTSLSFSSIANGAIYGCLDSLSKNLITLSIVLSGDNIRGNTDLLSKTMTSLTLRFSNNSIPNVHGHYANLPPNLVTLFVWELGGYWTPFIDNRKFYGDYNDLPKTITSLTLMNNLRSSTGSWANLPPNLVTFFTHQDIADSLLDNTHLNLGDLPKSITSLSIQYTWRLPSCYRAVHGTLADLPPNLVSLTLRDIDSLVTGNIAALPSTLTNISITPQTFTIPNSTFGTNKITYSGGAVPAWAAATITIQSCMSAAAVDNFLISWAGTAGVGTKTITLSKTRTAASDAAVITLNGKGKTIVTSNTGCP